MFNSAEYYFMSTNSSVVTISLKHEVIMVLTTERRGNIKRLQDDGKHYFQRIGPTIAKLEDGLPISLSAREMEVLALIAEGKSNQEISAELYLALNTVKRHAYNIFAKLEVKKRTQAVSKARQLGLIP
jgi:ATP/maltotriose-dependent transcriptional regulator MalT